MIGDNSMTVTVRINDVVANVLKELKGEPLEKGLIHLIKDYAETRIREYGRKVNEYKSKYVSFEKLERKILDERHNWEEERDLFDWEATITEIQRLQKTLTEIEKIES